MRHTNLIYKVRLYFSQSSNNRIRILFLGCYRFFYAYQSSFIQGFNNNIKKNTHTRLYMFQATRHLLLFAMSCQMSSRLLCNILTISFPEFTRYRDHRSIPPQEPIQNSDRLCRHIVRSLRRSYWFVV